MDAREGSVAGRRDQRDPRIAAASEVVIDEGGEILPDFEEEPTYEPSIDERRELARMLAERAVKQAAAAKQSLAGRAATRPRSAREALDAARHAEQEKRELARLAAEDTERRREEERRRRLEAQQAEAKRREDDARRAAERAVREAREAVEQAERDRQALMPRSATAPNRLPAASDLPTGPISSPLDALLVEGRVASMLGALGDDVEVIDTFQAFAVKVVIPLWRAHSVRARHDGDLATTLAAEAVHEALTHRPGVVVAARVAFGGRDWAVWLDTSRERVLAALEPAELYLVGC